MSRIAIALVLLSLVTTAFAENPKKLKLETPKKAQEVSPQQGDLHIIAEYIEVEHEAFSDWLFENPLKADALELRKDVRSWVKAGEGDIIETVVVHARSGNRAQIESIEEVIYPTEYDPPEVPSHSHVSDGAEIPVTPPTATAFETRNAGVTLEVDAVLSEDGNHIDLNLAPEIVQMIDIIEWEPEAADAEARYSFPLFHTAKATTQVNVKTGCYTLIGTLRLPKPFNQQRKDPIVLLFVRADAG